MPFLTSKKQLQYKRDISFSSILDETSNTEDLIIYKQIPFNKGNKLIQENINLSSSFQGNISNVFSINKATPLLFTSVTFTLYDSILSVIEKQAWYDFNDSSTVTTDSFGVTQVEDISGNNNTATQTSDSNKASYAPGTISFINNKWLDINLDYVANANHFAIAVIKQTGYLDGIYGSVNKRDGNKSILIGFFGGDPPSKYRVVRWGNNYEPPIDKFIFSEFNVVVWRWESSTEFREVRSNGFIEGQNNTGGALGLPSGGGRLGSNIASFDYANFDLKEIVFVTGNDVTNDNIQRMEGYLGNKYSLGYKFPSSHPYI